MTEPRDAVVIAPVAVAQQRQPSDAKQAALRSIETITRHLTGVIRALEDLRQELKK